MFGITQLSNEEKKFEVRGYRPRRGGGPVLAEANKD
jgi:hypothetical protein